MRLFTATMILACFMAMAADKKELTPEEQKKQEELVKEFGIYGKEYKLGASYTETTHKALKASKKEMKNKKVRYEGTYQGFNDNIPSYVEDSGFSAKKYHYLLVNGIDIPVMSRRKKDMTDLLGKLKEGVKVVIYGRVKEFRKDPKHGMMPKYCVELAHIHVLSIKPERDAGNGGNENGNNNNDRKRPFRRPQRR